MLFIVILGKLWEYSAAGFFFTVSAQHLWNSHAFLVLNPFSATLWLPLEGGDEKQNTIINSFMNIFSPNSDISRARIGNEGEKSG